MSAVPLVHRSDPDEASSRSLGLTLRTLHSPWLKRAVEILDPALNPASEFWSRWSVVRYLNDDFLQRLRWEVALLDAVEAAVPAPRRVRLEAERLARCRLALDRLGRRRSTGPAVAAACRDLLDQLARWCAEFEAATITIPLDRLNAATCALLSHLRPAEPAASRARPPTGPTAPQEGSR